MRERETDRKFKSILGIKEAWIIFQGRFLMFKVEDRNMVILKVMKTCNTKDNYTDDILRPISG